jgi:acyl-CoA thioester hydrolase
MSEEIPAFKFSTIVPVRFGDMDAMGHVNNATYLTYFEEARMMYYRHLFQLNLDDIRSLSFILAEATIKFRAPARAADRLEVFTRVSEIGSKSFRMEYHVVHAETRKLICEGFTVQVMFDYEKGVTIPVPDEMRKRMREFEQDARLYSQSI